MVAPGTLFGAGSGLNDELGAELRQQGFTGRIEQTLAQRLGRPLDPRLANIGRLLWFDTVTGLNGDNSRAGCHSPMKGFGDSQPIAIGIENNGIVGPDRRGPRNMRRAPMVINNAFFPSLMWNGRFAALSGDPFDNSSGFLFPPPEGSGLSEQRHLLVAQAFIPPTERTEVTGFDFPGDNDAIRAEVARRLNDVARYRLLFGHAFPGVRGGAPISFPMFARAIAEFEFSLTFANAPIDQFARGDVTAMTAAEKRGALLFLGKAGCASCHSVSGASNEMFTDFRSHAIAVPQLVPLVTNKCSTDPRRTRTSGAKTSRAIAATGTRSGHPRCGTSRSRRPTCTTARSPHSAPRSGTTSTPSDRCSRTTLSPRACRPTSLRRAHLQAFSPTHSTRCSETQSHCPPASSTTSSRSSQRGSLTSAHAHRGCAASSPRRSRADDARSPSNSTAESLTNEEAVPRFGLGDADRTLGAGRAVEARRRGTLTLLTTATRVVHHRCITGTAFGGVAQHRSPKRNRMLSQPADSESDVGEESGLEAC